MKSKINDRFYEEIVKKNDKIYDKRLTYDLTGVIVSLTGYWGQKPVYSTLKSSYIL